MQAAICLCQRGQAHGTGLISVEYTFEGEAAHSAGFVLAGVCSALDAAELSEHWLELQTRALASLKAFRPIFTDAETVSSNVVPSKASIWYYLRDITYEGIMKCTTMPIT